LACTQPGDIVLDPFFGTGTTGAVAKLLGRRWIGIEREAKYVGVASKRIAELLPLSGGDMAVTESKRAAPRVAFGALVETGLIRPGAFLTDARRRVRARVRPDGSLDMAGAGDGVTGSIHQCGAAAQNAPSCNGWAFWHVEDGMVPIEALRERYRAAG
ncbi:MAG: site-specific DNA-methyltransferase, partial [Sphingomonadaceae bacterium]|nr:site-specific DNA-methyltransferase [Sphingomonadaceae bacterium]